MNFGARGGFTFRRLAESAAVARGVAQRTSATSRFTESAADRIIIPRRSPMRIGVTEVNVEHLDGACAADPQVLGLRVKTDASHTQRPGRARGQIR